MTIFFKRKLLKAIDQMIAIQGSNGNWNYDPYMHGMLNGMIYIRSIVTGEEAEFRDAPKAWLKDLPPPEKVEKQTMAESSEK